MMADKRGDIRDVDGLVIPDLRGSPGALHRSGSDAAALGDFSYAAMSRGGSGFTGTVGSAMCCQAASICMMA